MQIEKRLIAFIILAIVIGIATIIPLEYSMTSQDGTSAQTAQVEASAQAGQAGANVQATLTPWFGVAIPYAYVNLHDSGGNDTMTWNGAMIQAIANFTLTPDALNLKNADAQIEFYQFRVSSEQGAIVNLTYSIAVCREEINVPGLPGGCYMAITGSGCNRFTFADGTIYDGNAVAGDSVCGGGVVLANMPDILPVQNYTVAVVGSYIADYDGNSSMQTLTELRNAQALYIDVSRICSVSYQGNSSSTTGTTTTMASSQVIRHIMLTKTNDGFVYGTYEEGTVPFPMETP
jgi:hypothetical protein